MKQALAPILFYDNDKPAAAAKRADPVAAAQRSDQALTKAARKRTQDGVPVPSFTSLLADLATICANHIQPTDHTPAFTIITSPTPLQRKAFAGHGRHAVADQRLGLVQLALAAPGDEDVRAFLHKPLRGSQPDTAAAAGDHGDLAIQSDIRTFGRTQSERVNSGCQVIGCSKVDDLTGAWLGL